MAKGFESPEQARESLRRWAVKVACGCTVQSGRNRDGEMLDYGWPCGSCFCAGLGRLLGGDIERYEATEEYQAHSDPPDRINEVWRFILQTREWDHSQKNEKA